MRLAKRPRLRGRSLAATRQTPRFVKYAIAVRAATRLASNVSTRRYGAMDATILFADVSGSHKLIETAGNAVALTAIARCIDRLRKAAESTGGRVVKTLGDEVMVLFDTPDAAAKAALVVPDQMASRKHCTVELRGNQFVLQDHSSNGTYVTVEQEKAILLKGGDLPLRRYGLIGFSEVRLASSDVVQFSCA